MFDAMLAWLMTRALTILADRLDQVPAFCLRQTERADRMKDAARNELRLASETPGRERYTAVLAAKVALLEWWTDALESLRRLSLTLRRSQAPTV